MHDKGSFSYMASNRDKKIGAANEQTLKELHLIALAINVLAVLAIFFNRPSAKLPYILFSIPAVFCQYTLEKSGRPKYGKDELGNNRLLKSGDEIKGEGLFEYMFDVIYVTWILDFLMVVFGSNKVWWLYAAIPGYASYKLFGFIKPFLPIGNKKCRGEQEESDAKEPISKRQAKLKERGQKPQMKYR